MAVHGAAAAGPTCKGDESQHHQSCGGPHCVVCGLWSRVARCAAAMCAGCLMGGVGSAGEECCNEC